MDEIYNISLNNFSSGFGSRTLIEDACVSFAPSTLSALVGRNGSGKSTLLRAIAGLYKSEKGTLFVGGSDITTLSPTELSKKISFVTTERIRIPYLSCRDIVAAGRSPYLDWRGKLSEKDLSIVEKAIGRVGMSDYTTRTMVGMSDGECQRVMIARALAQDTPIILLDEPTSFLDLPGRREIVRLLREISHDEKKCIIYSTHELDIAMRLADNIALVADKRLTVGTPEEMAAQGLLKMFYEYD